MLRQGMSRSHHEHKQRRTQDRRSTRSVHANMQVRAGERMPPHVCVCACVYVSVTHYSGSVEGRARVEWL